MAMKIKLPKLLKIKLPKLPLTTANFKKSDSGLFGFAALIILGGALLLLLGH
jgi:hypothetical protein